MKCEICGTECASAITARHLNGPNCRDYEGRRLSTVDYAALFGGSIGRGGCVYPGDTAPTEKRRGLRRSSVQSQTLSESPNPDSSLLDVLSHVTVDDVRAAIAEIDRRLAAVTPLKAQREMLATMLKSIDVRPRDLRTEVLTLLDVNGPLTEGKIAAQLNASIDAVGVHLNALREDGHVSLRDGRFSLKR